ncbi:MAG: DsbA family protein [Patescibacteria group bacterium]
MNKAIIWILAILAIIGAVFGLMKLASVVPNSGQSADNFSIAPVITDNDRVKGNKKAKISLIEYSDFQCPACGSYFPILEQVNEEFSENILFVYRHFPLRQIHRNADLAARASEASGEQGKFWEMHNMIFINQNVWSEDRKAKDIFVKYAENLELDADKFKTDIDSQKVKDKVNSDYQGGFKAGVNSTPSFFLNGERIQNPLNVQEFRDIINAELEKLNPEPEQELNDENS